MNKNITVLYFLLFCILQIFYDNHIFCVKKIIDIDINIYYKARPDSNLIYRITFVYEAFGLNATNFVILEACLSSKPCFPL